MPWDKRQRTRKRYYSRARKQQGMVLRQYLGSQDDPLTQLLADFDALERAQCHAQRQALDAEQALWQEIEQGERVATQRMDLLVRAGMLLLEHRQTRRGDCVRLRKEARCNMEAAATIQFSDMPTQDDLAELVQRAEAMDRHALEQLRLLLRRYPSLWQEVTDLSAQIEDQLLRFLAGDSLLGRECLAQRLEHQRRLLSRGRDSPLERLLVDQVARLALETECIELARLQPSGRKSSTRFWEQRVQQTQRRYLRAIRTLAQIRQILPGESTPTSPETG
ncbi:MAG: hypothetical protein U0840_11040 [Gemmataceae bacterium]